MFGVFELRVSVFGVIDFRIFKFDVELIRSSVFVGFEFIRFKNGVFLSMDLMWSKNIVVGFISS